MASQIRVLRALRDAARETYMGTQPMTGEQLTNALALILERAADKLEAEDRRIAAKPFETGEVLGPLGGHE